MNVETLMMMDCRWNITDFVIITLIILMLIFVHRGSC